jgi:hypothetical protein
MSKPRARNWFEIWEPVGPMGKRVRIGWEQGSQREKGDHSLAGGGRQNNGRRPGNTFRIGKSKIKEIQWRERRKYRVQNFTNDHGEIGSSSDMQGREELLPDDAVQHSRRQPSSYSPPWEPGNSPVYLCGKNNFLSLFFPFRVRSFFCALCFVWHVPFYVPCALFGMWGGPMHGGMIETCAEVVVTGRRLELSSVSVSWWRFKVDIFA